MKLPKFRLVYFALLFLFVVLILSLSGYFKKPQDVKKRTVKKENRAADKVIKAEQENRAKWQADSVKLVQQADSTRLNNEQLKKQLQLNKKKQREVRYIPVYTVDSQYTGFFSKRYGK